jgi:hypothetical protein
MRDSWTFIWVYEVSVVKPNACHERPLYGGLLKTVNDRSWLTADGFHHLTCRQALLMPNARHSVENMEDIASVVKGSFRDSCA